jgi:diacylglycerol kinase (ATP)
MLLTQVWYALAGGEEAIKSSCANLSNQITLVADGIEIPLPPDSQGIIFLNIDSYSGGVRLWSKGQKTQKRKLRSHSLGDCSNAIKGFARSDSVEDILSLGQSRGERLTKATACDLPSSCQDGYLDVVSIRGTFHLGQIRVGLSNAQLLCQCKEAAVTLKKRTAVQIDGEPWRQQQSILRISRKNVRAVSCSRDVLNKLGALSHHFFVNSP